MSWYLKKRDATVYGPVSLEELQGWAREGRIAPDDTVSQEQKSWIVAPNLPDLKMDWLVETADARPYGPLHLLALREPVRNGSIPLDASLSHRETGAKRRVSEALSEALLQENARLERAAATARAAANDAPASPAAETPQPAPSQAAEPGAWTEAVRRRDYFEREARKWKKMYEDERASTQREQQALNDRIRELRQADVASRTQVEQAGRRMSQMEKSYAQLKESLERLHGAGPEESAHLAAEQVVSLMETFDNLSASYDMLMRQLTEKSEELEAVLESRVQTEKDAEARIAAMQVMVQREQEMADKARRRLAEMEQAHLQVIQSYREMNDRLIRMRQGNVGGAKAPARPSSHRP